MSDVIHSQCAPSLTDAVILANRQLTGSIYQIDLAVPQIARSIRPGQFLMIRPSTGHDPLLGRPLAVYDVLRDPTGQPTGIRLVYQVFGRGTARLSRMFAGDSVRIWGPLGHAFEASPKARKIWFVAGGIGYTPFLALGKWWLGSAAFGDPNSERTGTPEIKFLYGARSAQLIPPLHEFQDAGLDVQLATDDGSTGYCGRVTDLMTHQVAANGSALPELIVTCGPEPMLAAVSRWAEAHSVRCLVSLENQMACGFGACFSCVAPIQQDDGSVDLRRVCLEGPIFQADHVAWH